jgi:putative SOS response-associated peptidase YedK
MCGRFTLRTPMKAVAEVFDLAPGPADRTWQQPLRFNIAPAQEVAAIRWNTERHDRELAWLDWGLIPSWAEDPAIGNRMINARAETVATKPAFRDAFRRRRCLVAADGFYEWKRQKGAKQPHYIRLIQDRPFAFAGLWEHWHKGDVAIESCTIITIEANTLLHPLHNRMPVIVDAEQYDLWLDPAVQDPMVLKPLLVPYPAEDMVIYAVSTLVNSPRHDTPQCIDPAAGEKLQGSLFD